MASHQAQQPADRVFSRTRLLSGIRVLNHEQVENLREERARWADPSYSGLAGDMDATKAVFMRSATNEPLLEGVPVICLRTEDSGTVLSPALRSQDCDSKIEPGRAFQAAS